jgi:hypothetical protein
MVLRNLTGQACSDKNGHRFAKKSQKEIKKTEDGGQRSGKDRGQMVEMGNNAMIDFLI